MCFSKYSIPAGSRAEVAANAGAEARKRGSRRTRVRTKGAPRHRGDPKRADRLWRRSAPGPRRQFTVWAKAIVLVSRDDFVCSLIGIALRVNKDDMPRCFLQREK